MKGKHYFVPVMDVLDKVGSEPELLELHTENDGGQWKRKMGGLRRFLTAVPTN